MELRENNRTGANIHKYNNKRNNIYKINKKRLLNMNGNSNVKFCKMERAWTDLTDGDGRSEISATKIKRFKK